MLKISIIMLMILFLCTQASASKSAHVKEGTQFYEEGSYQAAIDQFKGALKEDPHSSIINYNMGTALYKSKSYDEAIDYLHKSLINADSNLKQRTYYNLGNTFYKSAMTQERSDISFAIKLLKESLKEYEKSLIIKKKDRDAQHNYQLVKKELERLKKKQERQKNQKNQKNQQNQDQQNQKQGQEDQQNQESQRNQQREQGEEDQNKEQEENSKEKDSDKKSRFKDKQSTGSKQKSIGASTSEC